MAEKKQKERLFCDVEIRVGNRSFSAHKGILASKSDYFKTMFTINMKEKYSGVIKLRNISPETFELVLDYMYCGEIELTEGNVKEVLKAASLFLLADLLDIVDDYLSSALEARNAFALKSTCRLYSLPKLQKEIDEYILDNFNLFSAKETFLDAAEDEIRSYLSSDKIIATEDELVLALLKWTKADLQYREKSLLPLFSLIRLQHVSLDCLLNTLRKEPLLKDKEFLEKIADTMHYHLQPLGMKQQERRASSKLVQQDDICCLCLGKTINKVILGEKFSLSTVALSKVSNSEDFHSRNYRDAAVVMHRGRLILFGGAIYSSNHYESLLETSSIYSFDGQTWKQEGNLIFARKHATVASLKDGVLVFGGVSNKRPRHETEWYSNGACRTDPQRRTTGRICSQCVVVRGEKVFVIGGFGDVTHETVQKDVDIFCLNGQKQKGPSLNHGRGNFGACRSSTTIYVCGGKSGTTFVNSIECLVTDPIATSWTIVTSGESINFGRTSVLLVDNSQIIVLGGDSTQLYCFDCKMKCWKDYISLNEVAGTSKGKSRICKLGSASYYGSAFGTKLFKWEE